MSEAEKSNSKEESVSRKFKRKWSALPEAGKIRIMRGIIVILIILALLGLIYAHLMSPERWTLSMKMKGAPEITVYQGEKYADKGCIAKGKNKVTGIVRTLSVKTEGEVNTKKTGTYTITYTAKYVGKTVEKKRTVKVVENVLNIRKRSMYDTFGGEAGTPVIGLYGGKRMTVYDTFGFQDGYIATDETEGIITQRVQVIGQVDKDKPGDYQLLYSVTDKDGHTTTAERLVTVKKYEEPVLRELNPDEKIIYLTFDDGPAQYTETILSILDKYHVKATFFVTSAAYDKSYLNLIKKEAEHGHAVGVHTLTHQYDKIYSNDKAFWDDFNAMNDIIEQQTGKRTEIMRFPGGSSNTVSKKYNQGIMTRLANEATAQGYYYFDWNVMSGDAGQTKNSSVILENMKAGVQKNGRSVILCHDTHDFTMNAIEPFLQWALSCGYSFDTLQNGYFDAHQSINN